MISMTPALSPKPFLGPIFAVLLSKLQNSKMFKPFIV